MDESRFDALARAFSRRVGRRSLIAAVGFVAPAGAIARKRKRLRLGKTCDGVTDRCKAGECIDGVCACGGDEEPCRGQCVPLDTCCPRRRPRRCGNVCIKKKACCRAENECPCGGTCIRCGQCCGDGDCPGGPDGCARGVCRNRRCMKEPTPGKVCGSAAGGVCSAQGLCEVPSCGADADCPLLVGEDSRCAHRTCVNGWCKPDFQPSGTPLGNRTTGDCLVEICNGAGGVETIPDDDDVRMASQGCPSPRCIDGQPYCT